MVYILVPITAFFASLLTFFSGFGLGTLLMPVLAAFFPVEIAVAMTAVVHFLNGLFKLALVGRHVAWKVAARFGIPAILSAVAGAWVLGRLADLPPWGSYVWGGKLFILSPVKGIAALLMMTFAMMELVPRLRGLEFDRRWLPLGGVLSGFFGGLSGHQGALRSAFLARAGLTKEAFIATGVVIALGIDVGRLVVYARDFVPSELGAQLPLGLVTTAAAFLGAYVGNRALKKVTMRGIQSLVAAMLFVLAVALGLGIL